MIGRSRIKILFAFVKLTNNECLTMMVIVKYDQT